MSVHRDESTPTGPAEAHAAVEVPSRAAILAALDKAGAPAGLAEIAAALDVVEKPALFGLKRRLRAMERDGQIVHTRGHRFGMVDRMDLIAGRVIGHPDGYAFVRPDPEGEDIFIPPREARRALHGDRVLVRVAGFDRRDRPFGHLVEVIERANQEVVGRYVRERGIGVVIPDDRCISQDILIYSGAEGGARTGQIVVAAIEQQPDARRQPIGRIIEVLGDHLAPGLEVDVAIRSHGLPTTWPEGVAAEVAHVPREVEAGALGARRDLRALAFVTIDGADARDFDDAIYCRRTRGVYTLYVAIADVAQYVAGGSALDHAARERGTSAYFPDRVIPMLPEALSNGICSLNPDVDRLVMVCELRIDAAGAIGRGRFYEAVIRSQARLTYDEVAGWLAGHAPAAAHTGVAAHVLRLHELYALLRRRREARGALDIDTIEPRFLFNADRKIERIESVVRTDAHRLVEECMIAANVAAAEYLIAARVPALFRIHARPDGEKTEELRQFLHELGMQLEGGTEPRAADFAAVLDGARQRPDRNLIETVLLRSLKLAVYSAENIGHFGLALDAYTHFTSPIRRYPDLVVHRAIKARLVRPRERAAGDDVMAALGDHCSATERRADAAARDAIAWLKCEYMQDKVGETFPGIVSAVTAFGIFVQLDDNFVEGLIHVTALPPDYYHFDPVGHRLTGRASHREYRIGQKIEVVVARVSLDDRKVDFTPAAARSQTHRGRRRNGAKKS